MCSIHSTTRHLASKKKKMCLYIDFTTLLVIMKHWKHPKRSTSDWINLVGISLPWETIQYLKGINPSACFSSTYNKTGMLQRRLAGPLHKETASHVALVVKNPPANAGDMRDLGWTPGLDSAFYFYSLSISLFNWPHQAASGILFP